MANSTVLALAQSFCRMYGIPVPGGLQGSTDSGALQIRELIQAVGEEIQGKSDWQECSRRVVWTSVAGVNQGAILTHCPENFDHVVTDTFWNNTLRRQMFGPTNDIDWQARQVLNPAGPLYYFRIAAGQIEVSSAMPAGHTLSLIYKSKNWILDSGSNSKLTYTADNDTSYFSDKLMKTGLRAYWLRIKQMPHRLEMEAFDDLCAQEASQGAMKPTLYADNNCATPQAGLLIPIGNWTT